MSKLKLLLPFLITPLIIAFFIPIIEINTMHLLEENRSIVLLEEDTRLRKLEEVDIDRGIWDTSRIFNIDGKYYNIELSKSALIPYLYWQYKDTLIVVLISNLLTYMLVYYLVKKRK